MSTIDGQAGLDVKGARVSEDPDGGNGDAEREIP